MKEKTENNITTNQMQAPIDLFSVFLAVCIGFALALVLVVYENKDVIAQSKSASNIRNTVTEISIPGESRFNSQN